MYIHDVDKEILEAKSIIAPMKKELDIEIKITPSKAKTYHIDFDNHHRIVITTCEFDKYPIFCRVGEDASEVSEEIGPNQADRDCYFNP